METFYEGHEKNVTINKTTVLKMVILKHVVNTNQKQNNPLHRSCTIEPLNIHNKFVLVMRGFLRGLNSYQYSTLSQL